MTRPSHNTNWKNLKFQNRIEISINIHLFISYYFQFCSFSSSFHRYELSHPDYLVNIEFFDYIYKDNLGIKIHMSQSQPLTQGKKKTTLRYIWKKILVDYEEVVLYIHIIYSIWHFMHKSMQIRRDGLES